MEAARDAFWATGFAGTSLDELAAATGMNRPSLYAAFGDKRTLYLKVMDRYREMGRNAMKQALAVDVPLADALRRMYARAIDIYLSGNDAARGCFIISTAAVEAVSNPKIRAAYAAGLHELDDELEARFRHAIAQGELARDTDARALAHVACGIMNAIALRARAGDSRQELKALSEATVLLVCGRA